MKKFVLVLIAVLMAFSLGACGITRVSPNEELVLVSKLGEGKGSSQILRTGWHTYAPWKWSAKTYSLARQTISWTTPGDDEGAFRFNDAKGLTFQVDVGATIQMREGASADMWATYRKSMDDVIKNDFYNRLQTAFNLAGSHRLAEQIYGTGKAEFLADVKERVTKEFGNLFSTIEIFLTNEMVLPPSVKSGIDAQEVARQKAEQRNNEIKEAEAERLKAKEISDARAYEVERAAAAKATQITLEADAEAKAIGMIQAQLAKSGDYIEYQKINRWNGALPQIVGQTPIPMLNVK